VKLCTKCQQTKPISDFARDPNRRDGLSWYCKKCIARASRNHYATHKEEYRLYRSLNKNPEKTRERCRRYYEQNRERIAEHTRSLRIADPIKFKNIKNKSRAKNRSDSNQRARLVHLLRQGNDCNYRIRRGLRSRIREAIKNGWRSASTLELIGCSISDLRLHLESKFRPGMSWDNYGRGGWEIDHVRPCASFDLTDPEQQKECFHFTNLQPLWAAENRAKSDKEVST